MSIWIPLPLLQDFADSTIYVSFFIFYPYVHAILADMFAHSYSGMKKMRRQA